MYQLNKKTNIATDDFLDVILGNRGITDKERFLEPKASDLIPYSKLHNIDKAVALFKGIEEKGGAGEKVNVVVIVDSDIDGNTSSAILTSYIEKLFSHSMNLHHFLHKGKEHGITDYMLEKILRLNEYSGVDLLIVPDAGTSDYEHQKIISGENDIPILILDHHEAENGESEYAVVVNNQLSPEYPNKALSGVGVVYKFLQALDDAYIEDLADEYLDLVALGNISDAMDLTSPETRYLVYKGLASIKNKFLKEIILKQLGNLKRAYPISLSFSVIPKMNGVIRVGKDEEKLDLFKAFVGVEETHYNNRSKKNETLPQKVTRMCINAHKRQRTIREKWVAKIKKQIEERKLNENEFLLIELDSSFDRDLSGYLAGTLASEYRKPTLMLIWDEEKKSYTGSLRGFDGMMKNTKDFLMALDLFETIAGHQNACGFSIKRDALFNLNGAVNKAVREQGLNNGQAYNVDFYLTPEQLNVDLIDEVYEYEYLWGKGAERPLFAVDIQVDTRDIVTSNSSSTIKWANNGIDFVQFSGDRRLLELKKDGHKVNLTLVGSLGINYFLGKSTPQFLIEDLSVGELITEEEKIEEEKVDDLDDLFDW